MCNSSTGFLSEIDLPRVLKVAQGSSQIKNKISIHSYLSLSDFGIDVLADPEISSSGVLATTMSIVKVIRT